VTPSVSPGNAVAPAALQRVPELKPEYALFERRVVCLLGLPFDLIDMAGAVERVREAARRGTRCFLSTPNLNFVVNAMKDDAFRQSVLDSDVSIADGMSIVWAARLCGIPIQQSIPGSGLLEHLQDGPKEEALSVYLFGGADGVARSAAEQLNASDRGLRCVGYESPGVGSVEELSRPESIARINASGADFLVLSLGAQKGQAWIQRNRGQLKIPVISHLGAALNFMAGKVRRAPRWVQRAGLEWLWRIKEEPALWRRYVFDGAVYLRLLVTHVAPLAWTLRTSRTYARDLDTATLAVHDKCDSVVIRLTGVWTTENLSELRHVIAHVAALGRAVQLDLTAVEHIDLEFAGLVVMLQRHQKIRMLPFLLTGVGHRVRRVLELSMTALVASIGTSAL
jgi:N-acetylglucosaminyldiphosphoundecaprenol N-acetyl-beta-D-mannosaminyltransferase